MSNAEEEGASIVINLHFDHDEAERVFARANFEGLGVVAYCKRTVMEHALMYSWVRTLPPPWAGGGAFHTGSA